MGNIKVKIKPTWAIVKEIQEKSSSYLAEIGKDKELSNDVITCVTELIENAVKYGMEMPDGGNIEFDMDIIDNRISIKVSNGIRDERDVEFVSKHINKIKKSNDPAALYSERLMELMENPKPGVSQLGLYRIAYESEFSLDFTYQDKVLTIIAERKI